MSRGRVLGAMGNDAASSAQSKCAGRGKAAHLGSSRVEQGCVGGDGGVDSGRGVSTGLNSIVGDVEGL
jgi:hypothetical protein